MTCNPKSASARDKHEFNSLLADAYLSGDKESYEYIYNDMRSLGLNPQTVVAGISKDAYSADIADSQKTSLVRYTPGSDPWYIGMKTIFNRDKDAPRATEEEITRVYEATGDTAVLPKFKDGGYSVGGKDRKLEGEAYEAYLEEYGTTLYEIVNVMRDLPAYRRGTAEERAWWLTKAENFAHAVAVYHQDSEYSFSSKWFGEYKNSRPVDAAKYIVGNLAKK